MIVRLEDLRAVTGFTARPGLCHRGARAWCARHGIDWQAFRRDGIEGDVLLAIGDAFAVAIVAQAQARASLPASTQGSRAHG